MLEVILNLSLKVNSYEIRISVQSKVVMTVDSAEINRI